MLVNLLENESALEVLERAVVLRNQGRPIINLGVGQPDTHTPPHICAAAIRAIEEGKHGYTPPLGLPELRELVANYANERFGADVKTQQVIVTPGAKPAIAWGILICGGDGTEIIYPDPGFPIYASMARASGARAVPLSLSAKNEFSMTAEELLPLLTKSTRLLIVNSPHNPTGSIMKASHWQGIAELLKNYPKVTVLSDEIYSDFIFDDKIRHSSILSVPSLQNRAILVQGWSKSFAMTGWRLGWSLWPQHLVSQVFSLAVNVYSCPSSIVQYAGIAALTGSREPIDVMRKNFARRAKLISDAFNAIEGVSCIEPRGAFYVYPDLSGRGLLGEEVQNRWLSEIDVAVVAGIGFGATGKHSIRLSCAASDKEISEALRRINEWFQKNP